MQFLATTNPGLEAIAAEEVSDLVGADPERRYRGAIAFEADRGAVRQLNLEARSLHRVLCLLRDRPIEGVEDVYESVSALPVERYFRPDQAFAVRSTRHGDHDFSSVDVADRAGQAVIDAYRAATGDRPPVDLDDPDAVFRAFVREDSFLFGLDTTGAESLHRRWYRECEHNAPLRPTIAYQLTRLAGFSRGDTLLDPMCGSATVPIEAALSALDRPPHRDRTYDFRHLPYFEFDSEPDPFECSDPGDTALQGTDVRDRWVRCGRVNVREAGLEDVVTVEPGDATELDVDADAVVTNLPYGIRTVSGDLRTLYREFSERLRAGDWERFVALTTRPDLLDVEPDRVIDVTYGRLDAGVVVVRR